MTTYCPQEGLGLRSVVITKFTNTPTPPLPSPKQLLSANTGAPAEPAPRGDPIHSVLPSPRRPVAYQVLDCAWFATHRSKPEVWRVLPGFVSSPRTLHTRQASDCLSQRCLCSINKILSFHYLHKSHLLIFSGFSLLSSGPHPS